MSTIASLLSMLNPLESQERSARTEHQRQLTDTGLLELAERKRKQAAEQEFMTAVQHDPVLRQQFFGGGQGGGPVLGSLQAAPGGPGGGPMTQQTILPGQPPGAPQVVPSGQDLSRFATQGAPGSQNPRGFAPEGGPQSIIASLGAQPQAPPRNPLLEMAQRDPRAAFLMQQQMEAREAQQFKREEQRLKMGTAALEHVGQLAQGVTDQASLDAMRADLVSTGLGKYAAQLPQFYSTGAMEPFIAKAVDVKNSLLLQTDALKAQAELKRAQMAGRVATTDQYLKALGVTPGQEQPEDMQKAIAWQQLDEVARQAAHGTGQIVMTPNGAIRIGKDNQVEVLKGPDGKPIYDKPTAAAESAASYGDRAQRAHENAVALENKGITPSLWSKVGESLPFGLGNYLVGEDQQSYRQAVSQFGLALLRKESGAAISPTEYHMIETTFFPQPGNSKKIIEDKRREREAIIKNLLEEGKGAGRTGTQAPPTSQGTSGGQGRESTLKPVGEMSRDELLAERDRLRKGGG